MVLVYANTLSGLKPVVIILVLNGLQSKMRIDGRLLVLYSALPSKLKAQILDPFPFGCKHLLIAGLNIKALPTKVRLIYVVCLGNVIDVLSQLQFSDGIVKQIRIVRLKPKIAFDA